MEVEQSAVVTDYGNSALIHRSEIEDLNSVIRNLGKDKVRLSDFVTFSTMYMTHHIRSTS